MLDLFGFPKKRAVKKAARLKAEEESRKEKEMQTKIKIRKSLNDMKCQSTKLEVLKKENIEKAKKAKLVNNKLSYNLAKQGLRNCVSKQKYLDSMIIVYENALQLTEMNNIINGFVSGMNEISKDLKGIASAIDVSKAQTSFNNALSNNEGQYQALDAFLKEVDSNLTSFNCNEGDVSEEEIDKLIDNEVMDSESETDKEIDSKIKSINQLKIGA